MEKDLSRTQTFFRFEDLRVYHKAMDYIDWVLNASKMFPDDSKTIGDRFASSAHMIAFNIAEGSSRNKSQFVHNLKIAKSHIRDCILFTSIAEKQMILSETQIEESRNELMELTKMIGALIGSLQKGSKERSNHYPRGNSYDYEDESEDELIPEESYPNRKY